MNAPYRVTLSEPTTSALRSLTQKTGLSANILARFAMLLSFEMPGAVVLEGGRAGLTINRVTLFGDLEAFLMTAFALAGGRLNGSNAGRELASHIARGVSYLNIRTTSLTDFVAVVTTLNVPDQEMPSHDLPR